MRHGARFWLRRPFTGIVLVSSLGLAAAVATTILAVATAVLWRDLPIREPDRVVTVGAAVLTSDVSLPGGSVPARMYFEWKEHQSVFDDLAAYQPGNWTVLTAEGLAAEVGHAAMSGNMFDLLGAAPADGRFFTARDVAEGREDLGVLSYRGWTRLFGRDPSVIGRRVRLVEFGQEAGVTIVGVAAQRLDLSWALQQDMNVDIFTPLPDRVPSDPMRTFGWRVIGRLRDGVTLDVARARMLPVATDAHREFAEAAKQAGATPAFSPDRFVPTDMRITPLQEVLFGASRPFVRLLLASGIMLVLIACASAAGTMVMVASGRARELGIQQALGRSASQIRRGLLLEGLVVGFLAGVAACFATRMLIDVVAAIGPASMPRLADTQFGWMEMAIAGLIATVCGLAVGAIPAGSIRPDSFHALREGATTTLSKPALRWRQGLLGVQVALVLVLLVTAGLMLQTLRVLVTRPLGFSPEGIIVAQVRVPREMHSDVDRGREFADRLRLAVSATRAGQPFALAAEPPLGREPGAWMVRLSGARQASMPIERIGPGYFGVLDIPLLAGRDFTDSDRSTTAVIVNEAFARRYYGGAASAVGQYVQWGYATWPEVEIVGVVGDTRHYGLRSDIRPMVYSPLVWEGYTVATIPMHLRIVTRERGDVHRAGDDLRRAIQNMDPQVPVATSLLSGRFQEQTAESRLLALGLGVMAGSTLLLALIGIVALVGQVVADRMRELAIRVVLGSTPAAALRLTLRAVTRPAAVGLATGLLVAWWAVTLIQQFLFEVAPYDVRLWASAVAVLVVAAVASAWWPARRALRLQPSHVLRWE
jgi:putative ABC transport system permease protein